MKPTIIPPYGGWQKETYYIVDVSYFSTNPIHRALFYTGFLDGKDNHPGGYNFIINHAYDKQFSYKEVFYLKAIQALCSKEFIEKVQST